MHYRTKQRGGESFAGVVGLRFADMIFRYARPHTFSEC